MERKYKCSICGRDIEKKRVENAINKIENKILQNESPSKYAFWSVEEIFKELRKELGYKI